MLKKLVIRDTQFAAFAAVAVQRFEDDLVAHLGGDEQLRPEVKDTIAQGRAWGLSEENDVRSLLAWRQKLGKDFHLEDGRAEIRDILEDAALAGFVKIQRIRQILDAS